jgi:tRNA pseudouridine13 synthase
VKFKIKHRPEDFTVEEVASLPLSKTGDFGAYILQKSGWNTVDLLHKLSLELKIPFANFSYGGKKDRHSLSRQYISIKAGQITGVKAKDYSLEPVGRMEEAMKPGFIRGNIFKVIVRDLKKDDAAEALLELETAKTFHYPNYFDDQRFGCFDEKQGFLGEKILKKQFNGALKLYLTSEQPRDGRDERERKTFFFAHWKDWKACRAAAQTEFEKAAFDFLIKEPAGFLPLLNKITREELSLAFSAYQSYLWNEILRKVVNSQAQGPFKYYPGRTGDYIFYTCLDSERYAYLSSLNIPAPGIKAETGDAIVKTAYQQVLEANGIKNPMFNNLKIRKAFFKSFPRPAIAAPEEIKYASSDDELFPGKKKITLEFFLRRGSYATMLLKRVFS